MRELYRRRIQECQNLIEENRRLLTLTGPHGCQSGALQNSSVPAVESVILQSHVDTLQWQLRQVESSRQMYRAVMEEVVRFLERCHHSLDSFAVEESIPRSKSSHHVNLHQDPDCLQLSSDTEVLDPPSPPPPQGKTSSRLRCSTIDSPKLFNRILANSALNTSVQTAGSYTNFSDFTWRRAQKLNRTPTAMEQEPDKLSQEAFRLLRTANNLLNTHEPPLAMSKSAFERSPYSSPTAFCRNSSHGRTSNRSYCDSNSTSSASSSGLSTTGQRTSDKIPSSGGELNANAKIGQPQSEAESGFSSISSFQEVGLPLIRLSAAVDAASDLMDNHAEAPPLLPERAPIKYKSWDSESIPALPPKKANLNAFIRAGGVGEESLRVLWV